MRAKPRGHTGPRDRACRACRCFTAFVMLSIDYALASALDLAEIGVEHGCCVYGDDDDDVYYATYPLIT
jgi:hypothetical protein